MTRRSMSTRVKPSKRSRWKPCLMIVGAFVVPCSIPQRVRICACRPKGEAVDWLATECVKLRKHGCLLPFPFAALKKWVPSYAVDLCTKVRIYYRHCARVKLYFRQAESADNSIMSMAVWQLAFDKYALGAAMVQSGGLCLRLFASMHSLSVVLYC